MSYQVQFHWEARLEYDAGVLIIKRCAQAEGQGDSDILRSLRYSGEQLREAGRLHLEHFGIAPLGEADR